MTVEYTTVYIFGLVLVVAWPIGIPAFLFFNMYSKKDKLLAGDPETLRMFKFVTGYYTPSCWYWEVVEFSRKLCLAGAYN